MPTSPAIENLLATVGKAGRGAHQGQLDAQTRAVLRGMGAFLLKEGKSEKTVQVYTSLCAKALAQGPDFSNKQMISAVRALARFSASK